MQRGWWIGSLVPILGVAAARLLDKPPERRRGP
jgi:hypothetical protein